MKAKTVGVLRGGPSPEYEVSMRTGLSVLQALTDSSYTAKDIVITKEANWLFNGYQRSPEDILCDVDVVFVALHGAYGEDGTVQRLLERYAIPYTGSGPYASALAMHKSLTKDHLEELDITMPKHVRLTREGVTDIQKTAENIAKLFGPQYVIKPVSGGSSIGTTVAHNPVELHGALEKVLEEYPDILVEDRIVGREATVGILENFRDEQQYAMPVVEIIPPQNTDFFDSKVKYDGSTEELCPGRFTQSEKEKLYSLAKQVHRTLGLRHYSRSDFIVTTTDIYFLEVNTLPGLTAESLYPKAAEAVGASNKQIITHLIELATNKI